MSLRSEVIQTAQKIFETKGSLTLLELKEEVQKKGIVLGKKSSLIRTTICEMQKKDPRIQRVGRGQYVLNSELPSSNMALNKTSDPIIDYLKRTESELTSIVSDIADFNWLQCSDQELEFMRKRWKQVKTLSHKLQSEMQKIDKRHK